MEKEEQGTFYNLEETISLACQNLSMVVFGPEPVAISDLMDFVLITRLAAQLETALTTIINLV